MKKVLFLMFCLFSAVCYGQQGDKWDQVKQVNFYGVDYSLAKTFGVTEMPSDFFDAFIRINDLFQTEADKYTVGKWIPKEVTKIEIKVAYERNRRIDPDKLTTSDSNYSPTDAEVAKAVRELPVKETAGTGMIVFGKLLDKPAKKATYKVVFFDIASRRILLSGDTEGKAGGFGLRNYWARSVYEALKCLKGDKFTLYMKEPKAEASSYPAVTPA